MMPASHFRLFRSVPSTQSFFFSQFLIIQTDRQTTTSVEEEEEEEEIAFFNRLKQNVEVNGIFLLLLLLYIQLVDGAAMLF